MGLFSNNNRTNSKQSDEALRPITLRIGADASLKKTKEFISNFEFDVVSPRDDYHEIYARKGVVEYTISFIEDYGKTHISILGYSETHPLRIKKGLKEVSLFLRENLKDYVE